MCPLWPVFHPNFWKMWLSCGWNRGTMNTINRNHSYGTSFFIVFSIVGGLRSYDAPEASSLFSIYMLLHNNTKKEIWILVAALLIHGSNSQTVEVKSQEKIESNSNPVRRIDSCPMMDETLRTWRIASTGRKEAAKLIKTLSTIWRIDAKDHLTFSRSKVKPSLTLLLSLKKKKGTHALPTFKHGQVRKQPGKGKTSRMERKMWGLGW